ncbi:MAG: 2-C-methyl-D-erythritol 2,4-cyclodiphosphate synthase [Candidatus Omnitrophica bacterium]|nr:2-C-methyl-D-erythritol 2,4-cyclodiphosphate synthase [Candidatus Omnitrophota bacterium]
MEYRIGIGYDIHRFVADRKLFIGGVEIPYVKGLLGHSDGDVLLHAICDAFLGALAQGDIGEVFPDTDPKYQDISSIELLEMVDSLIKNKNFTVQNIDTVVIAQEPILIPFKRQIQETIASILNITEERVNVKAKTNNGLGELGRKEAIAAYAVALIAEEK